MGAAGPACRNSAPGKSVGQEGSRGPGPGCPAAGDVGAASSATGKHTLTLLLSLPNDYMEQTHTNVCE